MFNEILYVNDVAIEFVALPGGTFIMGGGKYAYEKPEHRVTLSPYSITKTVITQQQWTAIMGTTLQQQNARSEYDYGMPGIGPYYPMYYINHDDADAFIAKLTELTGRHFAIPSEAQWEYAATAAGTSNKMYSGSKNAEEVAWFDANCQNTIHPVGSKHANAKGIYDMSGNMWELCLDWYDDEYYSHSPEIDPVNTVKAQLRVCRGGGWGSPQSNCRVKARYYFNSANRYNDLAFRIVMYPTE